MAVQIIAEIGSVHDGSFGNALWLIDAAAAAGAGVVKFQTHIAAAETLRTRAVAVLLHGRVALRLLRADRVSRATQWRRLKDEPATGSAPDFMSSVFSAEAVDLMESLGVDALQDSVRRGDQPAAPRPDRRDRQAGAVLSSGMSDWAELDAAVDVILRRHRHVTVLQCTSAYPCPYEQSD